MESTFKHYKSKFELPLIFQLLYFKNNREMIANLQKFKNPEIYSGFGINIKFSDQRVVNYQISIINALKQKMTIMIACIKGN